MNIDQRNARENKNETTSDLNIGRLAAGRSSIHLNDNRLSSIIQKKQADALLNKTTNTLIQKKNNTTGLPDNLKSGIENLSGHSMDDVKVHHNSDRPAQLNAHAYAQGTDIHLAPGQEKHLPHEAWHVVQQKQGRVRPTMQMKGKVNVNDDKGLEKEADRMGSQAIQVHNSGVDKSKRRGSNNKETIQLMVALADATEANDAIILANIHYALGVAGGPVVKLEQDPDFSKMKEKEKLIIVGHGGEAYIGDGKNKMSGKEVADKLLSTESAKNIPKNIGSIVVLSCRSGQEDDEDNSSLINAIHKALSEKKYAVSVSGKDGLAISHEKTGGRVVNDDKAVPTGKEGNPGYKEGYHKLEEKLIKKHGLGKTGKMDSADEIANRISPHSYSKFSRIEKNASIISKMLEAFYSELVREAEKEGYLFTKGEGEISFPGGGDKEVVPALNTSSIEKFIKKFPNRGTKVPRGGGFNPDSEGYK